MTDPIYLNNVDNQIRNRTNIDQRNEDPIHYNFELAECFPLTKYLRIFHSYSLSA